jgi:hypothetical protein
MDVIAPMEASPPFLPRLASENDPIWQVGTCSEQLEYVSTGIRDSQKWEPSQIRLVISSPAILDSEVWDRIDLLHHLGR